MHEDVVATHLKMVYRDGIQLAIIQYYYHHGYHIQQMRNAQTKNDGRKCSESQAQRTETSISSMPASSLQPPAATYGGATEAQWIPWGGGGGGVELSQ